MRNTQHNDDVLAGNWIPDGNDELVTLTDDMFIRHDYTEETATYALAELAAMEQADLLYEGRLADLRRATGLTQTEVVQTWAPVQVSQQSKAIRRGELHRPRTINE